MAEQKYPYDKEFVHEWKSTLNQEHFNLRGRIPATGRPPEEETKEDEKKKRGFEVWWRLEKNFL